MIISVLELSIYIYIDFLSCNLRNWIWRHGYGRWQAIVDDKDLKVQEIICKELNLPYITLPVPGTSQGQDGTNNANTEAPGNQTKGPVDGNNLAADAAQGASEAANKAQLYQDSSVLYHFREMQRKQVEFIKKRVLLLEKGLNAEYQKEVFVSWFIKCTIYSLWLLVFYLLNIIECCLIVLLKLLFENQSKRTTISSV